MIERSIQTQHDIGTLEGQSTTGQEKCFFHFSFPFNVPQASPTGTNELISIKAWN